MTPQDAATAAQDILLKRANETNFKVLVDNPNDCSQTITAFRKLGCKVKVENEGTRLIVTPPTAS